MLQQKFTKAVPFGFVRNAKGKLSVSPTWITPEDETRNALAFEVLNRAARPAAYPKNNAAGPPDLRKPILITASRVAASGQPVFIGTVD